MHVTDIKNYCSFSVTSPHLKSILYDVVVDFAMIGEKVRSLLEYLLLFSYYVLLTVLQKYLYILKVIPIVIRNSPIFVLLTVLLFNFAAYFRNTKMQTKTKIVKGCLR